jgi:hypothetical protein
MNLSEIVTTSISFDLDWTFDNQDILILTDQSEIIIQGIKDRLSTDYGDYELNRKYGFNSQAYIGRPVDERTAEDLAAAMSNVLTFDKFLSKTSFRILWILDKHLIVFRLILTDESAITFTYNSTEGLTFE